MKATPSQSHGVRQEYSQLAEVLANGVVRWRVLVGYERHPKPGPPIPPQRHTRAWEARYLLRGEQRYVIGKKPYLVRSGEVLLTRPDELHSSGATPHLACEYYILKLWLGPEMLGMPPPYGKALARALRTLPRRQFPGSERLRELWREAIEWGRKDETDPLAEARAYASVLSALLELIRCAQAPLHSVRSEWGRRIGGFLLNNLQRSLTVADMAEYAAMVPNAFQLRFRREFGASPADFFLHSRMELAEKVLREDSSPIAAIARRLGFSSARYFNTVFRRCTGQSASAFRRGVLSQDATGSS